jgi:glycosyltransferase involved in cell wall biosynthesis
MAALDRVSTQAHTECNLDVSLIISTRDRCQQLARCLDALRLITFAQCWELIIVDNGSVDKTAATVDAFIKQFHGKITYLWEPKFGLGNAHNSGLAVSSGDIVAFTDDDCYPAADFLSKIWEIFEDDKSLGYITGRIMLHDPEDVPTAVNESTAPRTFPARSFVPVGTVQGANMAFRRQTLLDIGGFDPLFGPGALFNAEDIDAAGRASAMGWKGRYCPEVSVRHHHGRKKSDAPRQWRSAGIGAGAYHMKLLLHSGEWRCFAQSIYQLRRRLGMNRRWVFWEPVGAARYAYLYLMQTLRSAPVQPQPK